MKTKITLRETDILQNESIGRTDAWTCLAHIRHSMRFITSHQQSPANNYCVHVHLTRQPSS